MLCHKIVIVFCAIGFLIHSFYNLYNNFSNDQKAVKVDYLNLGKIPFPVVFQISIIPGKFTLTLHYTGYFGTRRNLNPFHNNFQNFFRVQGTKGTHVTKSKLRLNQTFLAELQGFKLGGGDTLYPPRVMLG